MQYEEIVEQWRAFTIETRSDLDRYLHSFKVLFAFHSGRIENEAITYYDTREIFEKGQVIHYTGETKALFEQQNQKLCYEYLKDKIIAKESITIPLIKEIHRILTSGTYDEHRFIVNDERPGEFKKHDYVTGIHEVGSDAKDVEADLQELLDEINQFGPKNPLKAGAYFHACFESIHPFADGNGRVGRTLLNDWLMINQYPPIIIYDANKKEYYNALKNYDEEEKIDPLVDFLKQQTIKTWNKTFGDKNRTEHKRKNLMDLL